MPALIGAFSEELCNRRANTAWLKKSFVVILAANVVVAETFEKTSAACTEGLSNIMRARSWAPIAEQASGSIF